MFNHSMVFLRKFSEKHPFTAAALAFIVVSFPEWLSSIWSMFDSRPLAHVIHGRLVAMSLPSFSPYFVTVPTGLVMFSITTFFYLKRDRLSPKKEPKMFQTGADDIVGLNQHLNNESASVLKREFTSKTPEELLAFYQRGLNPLQVDNLLMPFKGLWMRVNARITTIGPDNPGAFAQLHRAGGVAVSCIFPKREGINRFAIGDEITVVGKIWLNQTAHGLQLQECEISDSSPPEEAKPQFTVIGVEKLILENFSTFQPAADDEKRCQISVTNKGEKTAENITIELVDVYHKGVKSHGYGNPINWPLSLVKKDGSQPGSLHPGGKVEVNLFTAMLRKDMNQDTALNIALAGKSNWRMLALDAEIPCRIRVTAQDTPPTEANYTARFSRSTHKFTLTKA